MFQYFKNTPEEMEAILIQNLRQWPAWKKFQQISSLIQGLEKMALLGLQKRYPEADERELKLRLAALQLDRETMIRAFNWDPGKKGL